MIERLLAYDRLGDLAASPDFGRVAVIVYGDVARLMMLDVASGALTPMAQAPAGVNRIVWHPHGDRLLVTIDAIGAERERVAELDADTGALRWETGHPTAVHAIGPIMDSHSRPYRPDGGAVAFVSNARDPSGFDVVVRDLADGTETIALRGDNRYFPVAWSPDGRRLVVKRVHQNTEHDLFVWEEGDVRRITTTARYHHVAWTTDEQLVLLTDLGRDLMAPALFDVATREIAWLTEETEREVRDLALAPGRRHLVWGYAVDGHTRWFRHDLASGERQPVSMPPGVVGDRADKFGHISLHLDHAGETAIVRLDSPTAPSEIVRIDLTGGGTRRLTNLGANVPTAELIAPEHVRILNRDGFPMQAHLFRPRAEGRVPVVVSVHGGPEDSQPHEYLPDVQALLRHGIGVLAPDVRGSVGYGRTFQRLSIHDWGGGDVRDVVDCVRYLSTCDWVDPERLGIMGGSYGGFLTLACLVQHPELWRAGVDIFGPADLVLDAESLPPHWQGRVKGWIGDLDDPADRARLVEASPITHADRIAAPLLVIQGANDPRVTPEQSDRLVARLTELGKPVKFVPMVDEGHGFDNRASFDTFVTETVEWLTRHLHASGGF